MKNFVLQMKTNLEEMIEQKLKVNNSDEEQKSLLWTFKLDGSLHIGHLIPLYTIAKWLTDSRNVKILVDDIGVFLTKEILKSRIESLKTHVEVFLQNLKCPLDNLSFITTSSVRDNEDYVMEFYKLISVTSEDQIYNVLGTKEGLKLFSLVEPVLYINDILSMKPQTVLIGNTKEKIIGLAEDISKELKLINKVNFVKHPIVYDYKDNAMSKLNQLTGINVTDTNKNIRKKINKYFCDDINVDTSLFGLLENLIYPYLTLKERSFEIIDLEGNKSCYKNISLLKKSFLEKKIHPGDLKSACTDVMFEMLELFKSK